MESEYDMAIEKVRAYFAQHDMEGQVQEFTVSSATVELAAAALNCEPARIAKTLSFLVDGQAVLIVAAGDARIDNAKYKAQFGTKAKMIPAEDVESLVGHGIGGVCPFGVCEGVKIYLDISLKQFDEVYPACGSSNSAIKLTINQLESIIKFEKWVDVCKSAE